MYRSNPASAKRWKFAPDLLVLDPIRLQPPAIHGRVTGVRHHLVHNIPDPHFAPAHARDRIDPLSEDRFVSVVEVGEPWRCRIRPRVHQRVTVHRKLPLPGPVDHVGKTARVGCGPSIGPATPRQVRGGGDRRKLPLDDGEPRVHPPLRVVAMHHRTNRQAGPGPVAQHLVVQVAGFGRR